MIEYDGQRWHRNSTARDTAKTTRLMAAGLRVVRIRDNLDPLAVGDGVRVVGPTGTADDMAQRVLKFL